MNVEGNKNTNYTPKDLYWGLANMNVVAFNPTNNEKKGLGLYVPENSDEDNYLIVNQDSGVVEGARFTFILKYAPQSVTDEINMNLVPVTFRVRDEQAAYPSGWTEYCNKSGATVIVKDKADLEDPKYSWFMNEGNIRVTLKGEGQLLQFMNNFFDIKKGAACEIPVTDYGSKYFKGNFNDIKELVAGYPDNKVKCLLGINEYVSTDGETKLIQSVVSSFFFRHWSKGDGFFKNLSMNLDRYRKTDVKYQILTPDLPCDLNVYTPGAIISTDNSMSADGDFTTSSDSSDWDQI